VQRPSFAVERNLCAPGRVSWIDRMENRLVMQ
jgi:hypothetical protein